VTEFEMFCERCGTRYGSEESTAVDALPLRRRLLIAVGVAESPPPPPIEEPLLSFCLACRGYACHACWNDAAGFCQTCVPLPEPEYVALPEPDLVPDLAPMFALEPALAAEPEMVAERVIVADTELVAPELVAEPEVEPLVLAFAEDGPAQIDAELAVPDAAAAEAESEPLFLAEAVADPLEVADAAEAEPTQLAALSIAEMEPPLPEFTFEEIAYTEADPEAYFDWSMDEVPVEATEVAAEAEPVPMAATEAEPVVATDAEPIAATPEPMVETMPMAAEAMPVAPEPEPVAAAPEPVAAEAEPVAQAPEIFYTPDVAPVPVWPAPVFRPLEPMGPIVPPPPPALQVPRMEFDLPDPPPAFLLARQPMAPAALPVLPAGLFDGPSPAIRPCATCDLPVSAKARFCRRCGSPQA
jgi:hypothetical protein